MPFSVTNYQIKLLAAALMVIDHVGVVFFPDVTGFRLVGRLSFPLFAWLLVQGEAYTRNIWLYALRLLLLGVASQFIYQATFHAKQFNILFTLLLGLLCLRTARLWPRLSFIPWIGGAVLATAIGIEYEGYGILAIGFIEQYRAIAAWWLCWIGIHLLLVVSAPDYGHFQFPAVLAPLIFQNANHQQGKKTRWFYLFYPLHLLVLFLIRAFLAL